MDLPSPFRSDRFTPVRLTGLLLVSISMFLKAVGGDLQMRGFQCAGMTSYMFLATIGSLLFHPSYARALREAIFVIFLTASGLINPLLIAYLFLKPTRRRWILLAFGVLLLDALCVMAYLRSPPAIGFFVWVAGIILILAPRYKPSEGTFTTSLLALGSEPDTDMPK